MENILNDDEIERKIRENLTVAIKKSGLTQTSIAAKVGISSASLSDYMNKNKLPSLLTFVKLCKAMDISSSDILEV